MRTTLPILLAIALLLGVGCSQSGSDGKKSGLDTLDGSSVKLDSVGSKIKQGAKVVGDKLDTALSGIKTNMDEAQIQMALHQINGMDSVKVELSKEGHVTLTGSVPSNEKRAETERIVGEIKGVTGVTDQLTISGGGYTGGDSGKVGR